MSRMFQLLSVLLLAASSLTFAQEAPGPGPAQNGMANFVPIIAIFLLLYFLVMKPQKKQLEAERSMMSALGKGDEIYTKSGILGTIVGMTDKVITLEVSEGTKIKVLKSQIGGLTAKLFEKKENKGEKKA